MKKQLWSKEEVDSLFVKEGRQKCQICIGNTNTCLSAGVWWWCWSYCREYIRLSQFVCFFFIRNCWLQDLFNIYLTRTSYRPRRDDDLLRLNSLRIQVFLQKLSKRRWHSQTQLLSRKCAVRSQDSRPTIFEENILIIWIHIIVCVKMFF